MGSSAPLWESTKYPETRPAATASPEETYAKRAMFAHTTLTLSIFAPPPDPLALATVQFCAGAPVG